MNSEIDLMPRINCPKCGKFQKLEVTGGGCCYFGEETWLYDLNCECGYKACFSDHYWGFIWDRV